MIKVKLRQKKISGSRLSLYLDFYPPIPHPITGEPTRREFLKMFIIEKAKSIIDKQHNKETLELANQIRQKRENHLNKPEIYTGYEKEQLRLKKQGEKDFIVYFKAIADKRKDSNRENWKSTYNYLSAFSNGALKFSDLNENFCNDFKEYLQSVKSNKSDKVRLSQNSCASYFNKLKAALKQAYKDGYLSFDLNVKIEPIKPAETHRNFLNMAELNTLVKTDCKNILLKRAALFSAMTGLRFSDIQNLTWADIRIGSEGEHSIQYTQQKTKGTEVLPISEQAFVFLGEPKEPRAKVFEGLTYSAHENMHLKSWIEAAGITKNITFHSFRHTFATLQLSLGSDIYTVSKMLGHRELKTTQIYAKIIDQTKRDAADKIKLDL